MLDQQHDNLHEADGTEAAIPSNETEVTNTTSVEIDSNVEILDEHVSNETFVTETTTFSSEDEADVISFENHHDAIEEETIDYDSLSMVELVTELEKLSAADNIMQVKNKVEQIKVSFLNKYNHFIEEKKSEFEASNTSETEIFEYTLPAKQKFDQLYNAFRTVRNLHFKSLESNMKANLENRLALVEELKNLINPQENIKDTLKHFNDLRDRWKNAGPIPKDKYNHVWNNYHFHVENFYDYLHLDREARDLDFKHNLELKQKIVARCEELVLEQDVSKAFRELQDLHKIWKEDIGPVSKEHREDIWNKFSALTKIMHDKRDVIFDKLRATEQENLTKKQSIIEAIKEVNNEKGTSHGSWQNLSEKVEKLREDFFATGKVPQEANEITWTAFKEATKTFNDVKNAFYKDIKKEQNDNLNRKIELVEKAKSLQDSEDFAATTPIMKQIQEDWKKIGHVPRKNSDTIWKEFRAACNHYFDKMKSHKTEEDQVEIDAFDKKKEYLDTIMKDFLMTGDHKTDLDAIKLHIENWKRFGKVPQNRRHIDGKFNKQLDGLFEKLSLSKKDSDMMRFSNRMENLSENNDTKKLEGEKIFLSKKIDEVQNEIFQLENNIQFFANTRNAKKENSIVVEVRKNIAIKKEELDVWREKLKQLKKLNN
jgi:hypothetical protein